MSESDNPFAVGHVPEVTGCRIRYYTVSEKLVAGVGIGFAMLVLSLPLGLLCPLLWLFALLSPLVPFLLQLHRVGRAGCPSCGKLLDFWGQSGSKVCRGCKHPLRWSGGMVASIRGGAR